MAHKVTVLPGGFVIEVEDGEVLMAAANRQGLYWPTGCEGDAVCTRCYIDVSADDADAFSPMEPVERDGLRKVRWAACDKPGERLACQARVRGDAHVTKKYVRPARDGDVLPFAATDPSAP
ncbi:MAG: 2Fe-2S iron-sulfur cluster-binding protein [Microbacteriaceae bacterium]